ncbi:sensor histidine kinase [Sporosarcina sp. JAI121]|uniref:ATP-binding protein n=1 Tax=Sporosarcina sp. JAI121 TaxID=2723064 RepID=UPI0015CBCD2B|nr:sensor histidine kinase [Sporosarcina sp. JAI121]NYF23353.1 two-component system CitB family sensor kinase [Sporosarcina sp. JAI121]
MKPISLQSRIFSYGALFVSVVSIIIGVSFYFTMSQGIEQQIGERALDIARTTADRPDVRAAFGQADPTDALQPIAEAVRLKTGAEYVVIGNSEGIRYAHPVLERIGQKMVGDDNERALLLGESYISEATGTLGAALRGKTPVINKKGEIIGVVSVGFLKEDISSIFFQYVDNIFYIVLIAIILGIIGSSVLARNIKKELFNLEPAEIANLFTERNALIESVREGIIMVDARGIITTVNMAAYETLSLPNQTELIGRTIQEVLPNTLLPKVLETGERHLDRPMEIHGKKVIVNRIPIRVGEQIVGAVSTFRLQSDIDQLAMELSQVKRYTEALRAQTHEYTNFLYTISGLIQLNSYDEALSLIHDETAEHQSLIQFVTKRLQDPFLGGIVIGFFNRAKELKVRFLLDEDSFLKELPKHLEKNHFVSIIGNLVTNAFEATDSYPEEKRMVRIFILDNGEEILIEVEDSGSGISNEVLDVLFQEKVSTKDREDRGYGLVKVAENVKDLGGSVTLEKGDLGGALFIISIPKGGFSYDESN